MHKIKLPQATETMETGTVSRWLKAPGQTVSKGELLVEIETEEQRIELTASRSGRLSEILAPEGTTVAVGADLAILDDAKGASDKAATLPPAEPAATGPAGKVTPLVMPQAGNTMEEGTIVSWRVAEGDTVSIGDVIYEAETDKATIEVEADHAGRVARIVAHEGDVVAVKMPVAYLADNDADVDAYLAADPPAGQAAPQAPAETPTSPPRLGEPAVPPTPVAVTEGGRIKASPAARKAADERGLDLGAIGAGSGPGGRILLADVHRAPDTA
ncbi:MAG: E3 binding domain-containing protein, partial [Phycisphaerae bacterium]|nr:E3 binding domain-containing protein [Phycisphaerae bacterium]